ncbi:unnamed protein product [Prunus brigantina]
MVACLRSEREEEDRSMGGFSRFLGCTIEEKMGTDGGVRLEIARVSGMRDDACSLDVCLWKERKKMEEQSMKLKDSRGDACLQSVCCCLCWVESGSFYRH